jgi:hypothetical protein
MFKFKDFDPLTLLILRDKIRIGRIGFYHLAFERIFTLYLGNFSTGLFKTPNYNFANNTILTVRISSFAIISVSQEAKLLSNLIV